MSLPRRDPNARAPAELQLVHAGNVEGGEIGPPWVCVGVAAGIGAPFRNAPIISTKASSVCGRPMKLEPARQAARVEPGWKGDGRAGERSERPARLL